MKMAKYVSSKRKWIWSAVVCIVPHARMRYALPQLKSIWRTAMLITSVGRASRLSVEYVFVYLAIIH